MKTSLEQEYGGKSKPYHLWAPPLLAFAGLALLLALGRNSWVYSLPYGQNNSQVLSIKTSLLRGIAEVPKSFHLGGILRGVLANFRSRRRLQLHPHSFCLALLAAVVQTRIRYATWANAFAPR